MGTKVQCKSYLPGHYSMRDLNKDSNSFGWPLYYGDKTLTNGQYYNRFLPRAASDAYPGYDKDAVKRTMLEHEAIFKDQVYELHRLYRIQRDMMDEINRKEAHRNRIHVETSLSSSPLASQITFEDARKWHNHSFLMVNSICARPSTLGVEGIQSPLSSMKGNSIQTGPYPSQNGCSSKDIEVLESRPTKVRRKMFDLQLPADEYIDTEEGDRSSEDKVSAISCSYPNRDCKIAPEGGVRFFLDDGGKTSFKGDTTCLRSPNGLADLNEPIQPEEVKETNVSSYDFCNGKIHDSARHINPKTQLLGFPKEMSLNYGGDSGTQNNLHLQKKGNGNGWLSHVPEAGQSRTKLNSVPVPQCHQTEKLPLSSQPTQVSLHRVQEPNFYPSDKNKVDLWREKTACGVEISERSPDFTNNKQLGSFVNSHVPNPYQVASPDLSKSWSYSWEKPTSSFDQKSTISVQTYADLNSKSSQAPIQSDGIFGDRWHPNSNARCNPASGGELPYRNGFYQGSSSGSKELRVRIPSISGDFPNCSNENNRDSGHLTSDGLPKYYRVSNCIDTKSGKDMNLNVAISEFSSSQETTVRGIDIVAAEHKREDHLSVLPWLRAKPACKNGTAEFGGLLKTGEISFQSSPSQSSRKNETSKDCNQLFGQNVKSFSSANDDQARKTEPSDFPSNKKLLGFPIFEKAHIPKNESSLPQPSESKVVIDCNRVFDINLPCDPAAPDMVQQNEAEIMVVENGKEEKSTGFRHHIDLNSCLSDDDESLKPPAPITRLRITAEIDLEAPAVPETDNDVITEEASALKQIEAPGTSPEHNVKVLQDELMTVAAEAIVSISSSSCHNRVHASCNLAETPSKESSLADPLTWFVEIVSSCGDDLEGKLGTDVRSKDGEVDEDDFSEGFDYFESMILLLAETKEEDYMPKPLVSENIKLEETGTTLLTSRPRKGQARRGRQRRDFQRDILPGLSSLSRHEVTEDLQTFGGLMRATGHAWHSGVTRRNSTRNGSGRGRWRVVVSPSPPLQHPRFARR